MNGGRIAVGVLAAVVGLMVGPSAASAKVFAKSNFRHDTEKWKVVGDTAGAREDPDFVASGGSPGGFIQIDDAVLGGVMYWRAPKEFRGDQSDAFRGRLDFWLTQSASDSQFEDVNLVLEGHGIRLEDDGCCVHPAVFPTWTPYSFTLVPAPFVDATNGGEPATRRDVKRVLGDLDTILIRAEWRDGEDTDGLDTVVLAKG